MSEHNQDKETVIKALGGKKGLIDSGLPAVIFLVTFNLFSNFTISQKRHDSAFSLGYFGCFALCLFCQSFRKCL